MSRIRGKNTQAEKEVFRYLRYRKIYFQKHYDKVPGKPDLALPRKKKAVFIDGDFWHGRYLADTKDRLPSAFWREKIGNNVARDKKNRAYLRRNGWNVMRVWESDLKRNKTRGKCLERIEDFLVK